MKRFGLLAITIGAGCTAGPTTGQTYNGNTSGAVLPFSGYTDTKQATIKAFALTDPYGDPAVGPFTQIGSGVSASTATPGMNDPNKPAYYWSFSSSPISSALWRPGGLLRMKTRSTFNGATSDADMVSFDDDGPACAYEQIQAGEKWWIAGHNCKSPYPDDTLITMTSTFPSPAEHDVAAIRYLSFRGGVLPHQCDPLASPQSKNPASQNYYDSIDAPLTLTEFKTRYGFGQAG